MLQAGRADQFGQGCAVPPARAIARPGSAGRRPVKPLSTGEVTRLSNQPKRTRPSTNCRAPDSKAIHTARDTHCALPGAVSPLSEVPMSRLCQRCGAHAQAGRRTPEYRHQPRQQRGVNAGDQRHPGQGRIGHPRGTSINPTVRPAQNSPEQRTVGPGPGQKGNQRCKWRAACSHCRSDVGQLSCAAIRPSDPPCRAPGPWSHPSHFCEEHPYAYRTIPFRTAQRIASMVVVSALAFGLAALRQTPEPHHRSKDRQRGRKTEQAAQDAKG